MLINEKNIFWDWNGTLLDDANICLSVMNDMLKKRQMKLLNLDYYKEVFGFPVKDYYEKLGFDFKNESFEALSLEFHENYSSHILAMSLATDTEFVLNYFKEKEKNNIILSAMQQDLLMSMIKQTGLKPYFSDILGIDNIFGHSKSSIAVDYLKRNKIRSTDIILIGDTLHDFEVASEIGCNCILIANGHQSKGRLMKSGAKIVNSLIELIQN
jgi:phosphoglycolate phosphatase